MLFTCNYCGESFDANEYTDHINEHKDATASVRDTRYRPTDLQEARGQTRDTYNEWRNY